MAKEKAMSKIKNFFLKNWLFFIMPVIGSVVGVCLANLILAFSFSWIFSCIGWAIVLLLIFLLSRQVEITEHRVLSGKIEVVSSYTDLLEQTKASIESFNGYDEIMLKNVAMYSQMATSGVDAPIANSIISFSKEVGSDHTIILIGIDHTNSQWSVRVAGRSIYLSQLKAIWNLANKHLEENAKSHGTLIIKKGSYVTN